MIKQSNMEKTVLDDCKTIYVVPHQIGLSIELGNALG